MIKSVNPQFRALQGAARFIARLSGQTKGKIIIMKILIWIGIVVAILIVLGIGAFFAVTHWLNDDEAAKTPTAATKTEATAPASEDKKEEEPKAKIERRGTMKVTSLTPSRIPANYKPELTILVIGGENFGTSEVWIGDFRVAPDIVVSTESRVTIQAIRLYGAGRLWPKKWTVTVKRSDGQIATTTLTVGSAFSWLWLVAIGVLLFILFLLKPWKKLLRKKPAPQAPSGGTP